jgi:hypothetical protein
MGTRGAVITGGSDVEVSPTVAQVTDALRTVFDPELGMSVVTPTFSHDAPSSRPRYPRPRARV